MMGRRWFLVAAGTVTAALVTVLAWNLLASNTVYYLEPREALADRERLTDGVTFRLGGVIVADTIATDGDELTFTVTDFAEEIPVITTATPPELFSETMPVILEGAFLGDRFVAEEIILRHDEVYRAPDDIDPTGVLAPGESAAP